MAESDNERIMALLKRRDGVGAETESRRLLAADDQDEFLLTTLGMALQQQGRPDHAAVIYERLTWLYPDGASHWNNYATTLREAGQLEKAERAYVAALKLEPDNSVTLGNLGLLYKERANYVNARTVLLRAMHGQPDNFQIRLYAAMACYECADNKTVALLVRDWRNWPPMDNELRLDLAWLLSQMGQTSDAEHLLDELLTVEKDHALRVCVLVRKVLLLERVNRIGEAEIILSMLPDPETMADGFEKQEVIGALGVMAQRGSDPATTRRLLERLLAITPETRGQSNLYFALAKACDKAGDIAAALQALASAHTLQLEGAAQLVPELLLPEVQPLAPSLIRMTPVQAADCGRTVAQPTRLHSPIFVVGFPRSGTTMLEQMLDAHPLLSSMDEQPFMQEVSDRVIAMGFLYPEELGKLDPKQNEELVELYWQLIQSRTALTPGQRLVDKNPLNLFHLPLIYHLFPDAPIILALRHPCDVILSCYMQNFRSPGFQVLCSSLDRLARGYVNAMQYWLYHAQLFKPRVLDLRYEDLLENFDAEVERIGRFVGIADVTPLRNFQAHALQKASSVRPATLKSPSR